MDRKPLREPRTPNDEYLYDIASSLRTLVDRGDPDAVGVVGLTEPATFDPSDHPVGEVEAYLADADLAERDRVLAAERAGKARKSLVG